MDILKVINEAADKNFEDASNELERYINDSSINFIMLLKQIGIIPEAIEHDSTKEKLFSKMSDAVLARAFREIGLKSTVLKKRGNSADVLAESDIHGYTLVADAKSFRMSRTAKNQKDFKVVSLSGWRKDADYAVLCAPYFQYPSKNSQIYEQAIMNNVCLFSWEHLIFMVENGIKENENLSFAQIWGFSGIYSHKVICSDMKKCFINQLNKAVLSMFHINESLFFDSLNAQIKEIIERGDIEKSFWYSEMTKIQQYSREKAIRELIKTKKINEKIVQIDTYIGGLQQGWII